MCVQKDSFEYEQLMLELDVPGMDPDRFVQAFTHATFLSGGEFHNSYEPIENLGDKVVPVFIRKFLLKCGEFSYRWIKSLIQFFTTNKFFEWVARTHGLDEYIRCGDRYTIRWKDRADVVEALIGGAFYDNAFQAAQKLVDTLIIDHIRSAVERGIWDPVAFLEHLCQCEGTELSFVEPAYSKVRVQIAGASYVAGGSDPRSARVNAAKLALESHFGMKSP
jgi:dsRNA-specific ribonuclease